MVTQRLWLMEQSPSQMLPVTLPERKESFGAGGGEGVLRQLLNALSKK